MGASSQDITFWHITQEHLPLVLAWRSDREVMQYLPTAHEKPTWEEHEQWFLEEMPKALVYAIVVYKKRPVGTFHCNADGEVGIIIGEKSLWGKGVASATLSRALTASIVLATVRSISKLFAVIHPENIASQRVFAKNGFVKTSSAARNGQEEWVLQ